MTDYPRPSWNEFLAQFARRWRQGEHVFINGQTGSGKTDLLFNLMALRKYGVVFVTKPRDPIFKSDLSRGYKRMSTFRPRSTDQKILLAAREGDSTTQMVGNQQEVFLDALNRTYKDGGWTIGVDETLWISNRLKLSALVGDASFMGRALGLTVVSATQRPAHIPVIIAQSATHAFIGKTGRVSDLKTLAELGGDVKETERAIRSLRNKHEFVYVDTDSKLPLQIVDTHRV